MTVDVEGQEVDHDLPPAPDRKLGNTVKVLENYKDWTSGSFLTSDLVVIGKEGEVLDISNRSSYFYIVSKSNVAL